MYRTWLIPYLEETLGTTQRAELEARLAEDPALAADLAVLRQTLPRLRATLWSPAVLAARPEPLWPRLRPLLERASPRRAAPVWWTVGVCVCVLLFASSLANRQITARHRLADARWLRGLRHAPQVVFYRDNALETTTAARLARQARRVAKEKQAAFSDAVSPAP